MYPDTPVHRERRWGRRFALAAAALILPACSDVTAPLVTVWRATLVPVRPSTVHGRAAALTQAGRTRITISIEDAEPGVPLRWQVERGNCRVPGAVLGGVASYPTLEPATGAAEANAALAELFHPGDQLAVRVLVDDPEAGQVTVACAPFEETPP